MSGLSEDESRWLIQIVIAAVIALALVAIAVLMFLEYQHRWM